MTTVLLFIILAFPAPHMILLAVGRAAHFPGDSTRETVAFSTPQTSEGLDSGQNGDLQNTLLNTIKFYLAFRRKRGEEKKGKGHPKSM